MRAARSILNSLFSWAAANLNDLPPQAVTQVFESAVRIANLLGHPLQKQVNPGVLQVTINLLADALCRTPYGSPLELEFPLIISLASSSYCPFACSNCYSNSGAGSARGQKQDRMQIFAKVAATKTPFVIISGGEPLVADGIRECLKLLLDSGKFLFVSTNALVEDHLDLAQQNDGGLRFILPVWGNRQRHNAKRGANSFERVERNLILLNSVGQRPYILAVLSDSDLSLFEDVERLVRTHRVDVVTITRRIDVGRVEAEPLNFGHAHCQQIRKWQKLLQKHVRLVVLDIPELGGAHRHRRFQRLLGLPPHEGCSAGNWMMHIDGSGQSYPCFSFEGNQDHAIASDLPISAQWRAVRGLRAQFPSGALCVAERRAR